jgi:hypothetical protein
MPSPWQVICLAEGVQVAPTALLRLARYLGCDLRRLLNTLELWCRRPLLLPSGEAPKALLPEVPRRSASVVLSPHSCYVEDAGGVICLLDPSDSVGSRVALTPKVSSPDPDPVTVIDDGNDDGDRGGFSGPGGGGGDGGDGEGGWDGGDAGTPQLGVLSAEAAAAATSGRPAGEEGAASLPGQAIVGAVAAEFSLSLAVGTDSAVAVGGAVGVTSLPLSAPPDVGAVPVATVDGSWHPSGDVSVVVTAAPGPSKPKVASMFLSRDQRLALAAEAKAAADAKAAAAAKAAEDAKAAAAAAKSAAAAAKKAGRAPKRAKGDGATPPEGSPAVPAGGLPGGEPPGRAGGGSVGPTVLAPMFLKRGAAAPPGPEPSKRPIRESASKKRARDDTASASTPAATSAATFAPRKRPIRGGSGVGGQVLEASGAAAGPGPGGCFGRGVGKARDGPSPPTFGSRVLDLSRSPSTAPTPVVVVRRVAMTLAEPMAVLPVPSPQVCSLFERTCAVPSGWDRLAHVAGGHAPASSTGDAWFDLLAGVLAPPPSPPTPSPPPPPPAVTAPTLAAPPPAEGRDTQLLLRALGHEDAMAGVVTALESGCSLAVTGCAATLGWGHDVARSTAVSHAVVNELADLAASLSFADVLGPHVQSCVVRRGFNAGQPPRCVVGAGRAAAHG